MVFPPAPVLEHTLAKNLPEFTKPAVSLHQAPPDLKLPEGRETCLWITEYIICKGLSDSPGSICLHIQLRSGIQSG